jgi:signal transduction histidine kinase
LTDTNDFRCLVLAPRGRDGAVLSEILNRHGLLSHVCGDISDLIHQVPLGAGLVIVTEEALVYQNLDALTDWLNQQEPWSDLPFIVLAAQRNGLRPRAAREILASLANVVLLERPINAETLQQGATSALRARRRQYVARDHLEERRRAAETLELRIHERTRDLAEANDRLLAEIAEKERMQAVLVQSQKMEAIGQLTGGVAHDFNNLLTIIRSSIDFLRNGTDMPEPRRMRYMDAISQTVDRAAKLTGQLLSFARRQALTPSVFDVGRQVESVADLVRPLVGARIDIDIETSPEVCLAKADISQFETALINLAVNARDAMNGEGHLSFKVEAATEIPALRGHASAAGSFVAVTVSDSGPGIAVEQLTKVFEPFFTTKEVGKGTGLGLSQVFGFAKQSGGEVNIETAPGKGASFRIYLPRSEENGSTTGVYKSAVANETATVGQMRVLVVEDNDAVGQFAVEMLADLGHVPVRAANAAEALSLLDGDGGLYDAVFSDVVMPGMNGIEMARAIRERFPELPILLTSGYSNVLATEGTDGFDLLHKPYSVQMLSERLAHVANAGVPSKSP